MSLLFVSHAQASALPMGWTNLRALGMGNAYTAVVDDADALFYNPGALAHLRQVKWTILDFRLGLNGIDSIQDAQAAMDGANSMAEALNALYGKQIWLGAGAKSAIAMPYFALAAFANTETSFSMHNPPNPVIDVGLFFDYGYIMGGAIPIVPQVLGVGMALRRVNRTGSSMPIGAATLATLDGDALQAEFRRRGVAYGLDIGTKLVLPGAVNPSLSLVYRDIGFTAFTHDEGAGAPARIEPELVVGGSLLIDSGLMSITPSFDYRFADRKNVQIGKKLNFGLEFDLPLLALRAGLHQGYMTAGVGLELGIMKFDVATWGVELGEFPGQKEDRRYMLQFVLEMGVDLGFSSSTDSSSKGKGRPSLKRRR
jgi:hypothetical protein